LNKRELQIQRMQIHRQYHRPGSNEHTKCVINHVAMRPNSWEHEQAKALKAWELMKEGKQFITEAKEIGSNTVRDLVCLDDGEIYEFETDPKRAARFKGQGVNVIMIDRNRGSAPPGGSGK